VTDTHPLRLSLLNKPRTEGSIWRSDISKTGNYGGLLICETLSVPKVYRGHKFGLLREAMVILELAGTKTLLPTCLPDYEIMTLDYFACLNPRRTDRGPSGWRSDEDPERVRRIRKEFGFRRRTVSRRPHRDGPASTDVYWLPNGDNKVASANVRRYFGAAMDAGPIIIPTGANP
jgi:hypothetical protein